MKKTIYNENHVQSRVLKKTLTIQRSPVDNISTKTHDHFQPINPACLNPPLVGKGMDMILPHGGLPEVISSHLCSLIERTGGVNGPIGLQFVARPELERKNHQEGAMDPLSEDEYEIVPGVIYKYRGEIDENGNVIKHGRVLWTVTRFCASFCRFCTRGREVGLPVFMKAQTCGSIAQKALLSDEDIRKVMEFLKNAKEVNEVILSGGDPLTAPKPYLTKIVKSLVVLQKSGDLDIIRIGTRLPVHNPGQIQEWHYQLLSEIKNVCLMVHINHPAELTAETLEVLYNFRKKSLATVFSQSVLLKGVNDSEEILQELFETLAKEGVRPYYIYQNDPVYWAEHFTVPVRESIDLWQRLRPRLSGIAATARFVIDTPYGFGKIPIPEGEAWKVDYSCYYDFKKKKHSL